MTMQFVSSNDIAAHREFYEQAMVSEITLERADAGGNDYGKQSYGAPEQVKAKITRTLEQTYGPDGNLQLATAKVTVPYGTNVTARDRITLPNSGRTALILSVMPFPSDSWPLCERILLGKV